MDARNKVEQIEALKTYVRKLHHILYEEALPFMACEIYLLFLKEVWKTIIKVSFFKEANKNTESVLKKFWLLFVSPPDIYFGLLAVLTETEKLCLIDQLGALKPFMLTEDFKILKTQLLKKVVLAKLEK